MSVRLGRSSFMRPDTAGKMFGEASTTMPTSATHGLTAASGFGALMTALLILHGLHPFGNDMVASVLFAMAMTAAGIAVPDILWQKVHRRASTGLDFAVASPSWSRTGCKLYGLATTLALVAGLYWLFPEYQGAFYLPYYHLLWKVLPYWLVLAVPYFYLIDRHIVNPQDGYWHLGKLATFQWELVDRHIVCQHVLGWLIKGFFLPLMIVYFCQNMEKFMNVDFSALTIFRLLYDFLFDSVYMVDVALASVGYLVSLRVTDSHLRSAESTMLGWTAALVCYEPFWSLIGSKYFSYGTGYVWGEWLWDRPVFYCLWGSGILMLSGIYVWATAIFGARFSNLTNRGIITNGPYRWTKHPAYLTKNLSWWMISIPFLTQGTPDEALRHCLLLLGLNGIYLLRAKTEEWHLSRDPDYVLYAQWIEQHGLFSWARPLPACTIRRP